MISIRKAEKRGHADHGWLNANHTFSFAGYFDPQHMGFRTLRVLNDDTIIGGAGFDTHPHRDMEIITYILSGALEHRDSMGNGRVIRTGEFQYMAAGTGVTHSEFNASPIEPAHLLQTWILPERKGFAPRYEERSFAAATSGQLHLVASHTGRDGSMQINQDADLYLAKLSAGEKVEHAIAPRRHLWIHVATGKVELNGTPLNAGDGAGVSEESALTLAGVEKAEVLIFDLN
jgi:redox-sensitive bicupin YhaK (pirin superfamily)